MGTSNLASFSSVLQNLSDVPNFCGKKQELRMFINNVEGIRQNVDKSLLNLFDIYVRRKIISEASTTIVCYGNPFKWIIVRAILEFNYDNENFNENMYKGYISEEYYGEDFEKDLKCRDNSKRPEINSEDLNTENSQERGIDDPETVPGKTGIEDFSVTGNYKFAPQNIKPNLVEISGEENKINFNDQGNIDSFNVLNEPECKIIKNSFETEIFDIETGTEVNGNSKVIENLYDKDRISDTLGNLKLEPDIIFENNEVNKKFNRTKKPAKDENIDEGIKKCNQKFKGEFKVFRKNNNRVYKIDLKDIKLSKTCRKTFYHKDEINLTNNKLYAKVYRKNLRCKEHNFEEKLLNYVGKIGIKNLNNSINSNNENLKFRIPNIVFKEKIARRNYKKRRNKLPNLNILIN